MVRRTIFKFIQIPEDFMDSDLGRMASIDKTSQIENSMITNVIVYYQKWKGSCLNVTP